MQDVDELYMDSKESSSIEDKDEEQVSDPKVGRITGFVDERFYRAEKARYTDEQRWIKSYQNYRGIYGPDVQFTTAEKSRVFIKVTKTKVLAAYGQIVDVLFGSNKFPISINPTKLPDGIAESVHFETDPTVKEMKKEEPENISKLQPGETVIDLQERLGALNKKLEPVADIVDIEEGPGRTPSKITFNPAMVAAKKMEKKILDQLEESNAKKQLRVAAFECSLFGTGIMKGPFALDKEYPSWTEEGEYSPTIKTVPQTSSVSLWNFYPDPDANNMDEAEYVIEKHKMSKNQLRSLKRRPYFRSNAIDVAISMGESYIKEWWEQIMEDADQEARAERYSVLEFWGYVDTEILEENDVEIPKELKGQDQVSANIWICNGQVLRLVMNPFTPSYLPYYAVPFEINPYSFFGIGIAENMDDTQTLMNGFMRMAIDNAALSGNLLI